MVFVTPTYFAECRTMYHFNFAINLECDFTKSWLYVNWIKTDQEENLIVRLRGGAHRESRPGRPPLTATYLLLSSETKFENPTRANHVKVA